MNAKTPSDSIQRESDIPTAEAMPGIPLPTAQTAGQGVILPTAKDTMGRTAEALGMSMADKNMPYKDGRNYMVSEGEGKSIKAHPEVERKAQRGTQGKSTGVFRQHTKLEG